MIKKIRFPGFTPFLALPALRAEPAAPLRLLQTTLRPGVEGRVSHFDVDLAGHRLLMTELGNNALELFDLRTNRLNQRIFIANGDDEIARIFDGSTFNLFKTVDFASDPDDTHYLPATNPVVVGCAGGGHAWVGFSTAPPESTGRPSNCLKFLSRSSWKIPGPATIQPFAECLRGFP